MEEWTLFSMLKFPYPLKTAFNQCVLPVMTYGYEKWTLNKRMHTENHGETYAWYNQKRQEKEFMGKKHFKGNGHYCESGGTYN